MILMNVKMNKIIFKSFLKF